MERLIKDTDINISIEDLEQLTTFIMNGTFEQALSIYLFPMIGKIKEVVDENYNRRKEVFEEVGLKWN